MEEAPSPRAVGSTFTASSAAPCRFNSAETFRCVLCGRKEQGVMEHPSAQKNQAILRSRMRAQGAACVRPASLARPLPGTEEEQRGHALLTCGTAGTLRRGCVRNREVPPRKWASDSKRRRRGEATCCRREGRGLAVVSFVAGLSIFLVTTTEELFLGVKGPLHHQVCVQALLDRV